MLRSEEEVLSVIDSVFPPALRGDDCVELSYPSCVVSVDTLSENNDFRRTTFSPHSIGHKVLAANISDILAMGAKPTAFLMALSITKDTTSDYLQSILHGMHELAEQYAVQLVGGDIDTLPFLSFSITVFGVPYASPLYRAHSQPGDVIFTIAPPSISHSPLGLARLGFHIIEKAPELSSQFPVSCAAQRTPALVSNDTIRRFVEWIEHTSLLHNVPLHSAVSLMDISDGLVQDLPRLLGKRSSLSANITLPTERIHPEILSYCSSTKTSPVDYIMKGGEEYCLLGTVPQKYFEDLCSTIPGVIAIGTVIHDSSLYYNGAPYTQQGFDHCTK